MYANCRPRPPPLIDRTFHGSFVLLPTLFNNTSCKARKGEIQALAAGRGKAKEIGHSHCDKCFRCPQPLLIVVALGISTRHVGTAQQYSWDKTMATDHHREGRFAAGIPGVGHHPKGPVYPTLPYIPFLPYSTVHTLPTPPP